MKLNVNVVISFNSFITEVPIIWKPVNWLAKQINGLVSIWQGPPSWKSYEEGESQNSQPFIWWKWVQKQSFTDVLQMLFTWCSSFLKNYPKKQAKKVGMESCFCKVAPSRPVTLVNRTLLQLFSCAFSYVFQKTFFCRTHLGWKWSQSNIG